MQTKREKQKSALVRRKADEYKWLVASHIAKTDAEREFADRKLFMAKKDIRALESKLV